MSGLEKAKKENKEKSLVFTKETFGVVLVLFSALCLVCLITDDAVFSVIGKFVSAFLFGCFGFFAYAVMFTLFGFGILLISGKKVNFSAKRKALITAVCFAFVLILQLATVDSASLGFGEYLSLCYNMGANGFAKASAGGLFTGIISYLLCKLLTGVGSYIILSLAIFLLLFGFAKDVMKNDGQKRKKDSQKFRTSFVQEEDMANVQTVNEVQSADQVLQQEVQTNAFSSNIVEKPKQKLFINNPEDFSLKSKREIQKDTGASPIKLEVSEGGLNVVRTEHAKVNTIKKDDEYKKKIDYIKTPTIIDMEKYSSVDYYGNSFSAKEQSGTTISSYISPKQEEPTGYDENAEIPFFEHDNSKKSNQTVDLDSAEARAKAFEQRYLDATENQKEIVEEPVEIKEVNQFDFSQTQQVQDDLVDKETETHQEQTGFSSRASRFTFASAENEESFAPPMIEEDNADYSATEKDYFVEEKEAGDIAFDDVEDLPQTNIKTNDRIRDIFSEPAQNTQTVGYTSRVTADNNGVSRRSFIFEDKQESKTTTHIEQKPQPPINREYFRPPFDLLESYAQPFNAEQENHEERKAIIKRTLEEFRIDAIPQGHVQGPTITRYEIMMPAGISVKSVLKYDDDLKMRLSAKNGVRIEAPIPGKNLVGIEVANNVKVTVGLKEVMEGLAAKKDKTGSLMFALGKDIVGNAISDDLTKGPHYLIAGATGSGKSVCLHVMLVSLLMRYSPEELKLVLVDPKCVEFRKYEHLPHLLVDEIINEPKRALSLLQWAYDETTRRNEMFTACGGHISNIDDYNSMIASDTVPKLPRIVFVIDELADLMEACKKDLEARIRMIAAKSRSAGIHLVLATQRPSVDVITGTIKANLPSRIALKVMNFADSQTILGGAGAEKLLGNGDMLYKNSSMADYERYQGAYISGREIANVVEYIKEKNTAYFDEDIMKFLDNETRPSQEEAHSSHEEGGANEEFNDFFLKALWFAVKTGTVSISSLQRRFSIGYPRAGSIFDKMEQKGFISPNEGGKARRVLLTPEEYVLRFGPGTEEY